MTLKLVIIAVLMFDIVWCVVKLRIAKYQRYRPLPEEVSDIYDSARYQTFLEFEENRADYRLCRTVFISVVEGALFFSPVFKLAENMFGESLFAIAIFTQTVFIVVKSIVKLPFDYYFYFVLEDRYGFNKMNKKEFAKEEVTDFVTSILTGNLICGVFVYLTQLMMDSAKRQNNDVGTIMIDLLLVIAAFAAVIVVALVIILVSLRLKYRFTPMPDGALKDKIYALQEGSKKKIKRIYIYNESDKTTTKNAFCMKLPFYRFFGIADNYMNENSEREILAVLSHEIGHLKYKKTLADRLIWVIIGALFVALFTTFAFPELIIHDLKINDWVNAEFGLTVTNGFIMLYLASMMYRPLSTLAEMYMNHRSRVQEYYADSEAVRNGYGEDLIKSFKDESRDELIDINPHPLLVVLYHNHPTIYQRIVAIRKGIEEHETAYNQI